MLRADLASFRRRSLGSNVWHQTHYFAMRLLLLNLAAAACLASVGSARAQVVAPAASEVRSTVDRFHAALAAGDAMSATKLLATDAVVLEAGGLESRQQYLDHHLAADIRFASSVPSTRGNFRVTQMGEVAWVTSTSSSAGVFDGRQVNLVGAELVVLSKVGENWLIRAIHWSSRSGK